LRGFESEVRIEDRGDFFVFSARSEPLFEFDCELVTGGLHSERSGEYSAAMPITQSRWLLLAKAFPLGALEMLLERAKLELEPFQDGKPLSVAKSRGA